jgi:hypothetical protein
VLCTWNIHCPPPESELHKLNTRESDTSATHLVNLFVTHCYNKKNNGQCLFMVLPLLSGYNSKHRLHFLKANEICSSFPRAADFWGVMNHEYQLVPLIYPSL